MKKQKEKRKYFIRGLGIGALNYGRLQRRIGKVQYNAKKDAFQFHTHSHLDEIIDVIREITSGSIEIDCVDVKDKKHRIANIIIVGRKKEFRDSIEESLARDSYIHKTTKLGYDKGFYLGRISVWELLLELLKKD